MSIIECQMGEYCVNNYSMDDGTAGYTLCSINYEGEDLTSYNVIPNTINDIPVIRLSTNCYRNKNLTNLTSINNSNENVIIPDNLRIIGPTCMYGTPFRFSNLNNIEIIEANGLEKCDNIYILESDKIHTIGSSAISNMKNLLKVYFPNLTTARASLCLFLQCFM